MMKVSETVSTFAAKESMITDNSGATMREKGASELYSHSEISSSKIRSTTRSGRVCHLPKILDI